jgi:pimeloyl-ACP methyl ester carboxylesterase
MSARRLLSVATAATGAAVAYGLARRRVARRVAADPEAAELRRRLPAKAVEVVSADGTRLHTEIHGAHGGGDRATTVVLVHGWCCAVRFWHYQLRDLAAGFRVVAYDLRGHGRSSRPSNGDYSTDALAADLDAVLTACVPPGERPVLAGHSMGGMSVVAWAGAHADQVADRVAGVVLIDTGMRHLVAESGIGPKVTGLSRVRTAVGRVALALPVPVGHAPEPLSYAAIRRITMSRHARPAHVAFSTDLVADCSARVRAAFGRTLAGLDLVDHLANLVVPAVVVVGGDDVLTPPGQARRIAARVPGARLFELAGHGHMSPVSAHDAVTRHIREMATRS